MDQRDALAIFLKKFVRDENIATVLELGTGIGSGSFGGFNSAKAMIAGGVKVVVTIDKGTSTEAHSEKIIFYNSDITLIDDVIHKEYPERFDMIFMDADHDYSSVKLYWKLYSDLAKRYIVFHDRAEPGTAQILRELESEYKVTHVHQPPNGDPRIGIVDVS